MSNYEVIDAGNGRFIKAWNQGVKFEEKAIEQLKNTAQLPFIHKHLAAMPDSHWGMGSTVGTVLPTKNAIVPAAVGVDIGCFSYGTKIPLLDGKEYEYPIGQLADAGQEVYVWSCDDDGQIWASPATPKKTRENADLVQVCIDNGSQIICTPDQKFQARDGSYTEAQNLGAGFSLMPFYSKMEGGRLLFTTKILRRVISVTPLDYKADVFCLTVPKYHNFALAAGVFVHNCGMSAIKTNLSYGTLNAAAKAPSFHPLLPQLRAAIEKAVPCGRTDNGGPNDRGAWHNIPEPIAKIWAEEFELDYAALIAQHPGAEAKNTVRHLGTLGTGNHFIELAHDELDVLRPSSTPSSVWIILHSGSRGLGNKIGAYFTKLAKEKCERWFINLPDPDLAYFPRGEKEFDDYISAASLAQRFAWRNREVMLDRIKAAISPLLGGEVKELERVHCHHNYVVWESHFGENVLVTRKGAVRARVGDLAVIPGSMGASTFIARGLGNVDSFSTCSHGAGRSMSRAQALRDFTLDDHIKATAGIECDKTRGTLDETPNAYKDINLVMEAQRDLVQPIHRLTQFVNVKGITEESSWKTKKKLKKNGKIEV
jgi:tRNA-splicing ligase RtcB (3'-phosphate/5'-hydroxy nucleic acid ligase)